MPPKKIFILNSAGGCGCCKPKISSVHKPMPKPGKSSYHDNSSSTLTSLEKEDKTTTTTHSFHSDRSPQYISESESSMDRLKPSVSPRVLSPLPKINQSVAVVKDSGNPYKDFRASMKQMIDEREIHSEDELKELLRCFLEINSPGQQNVIVRAFVDVCSDRMPLPQC